MRGKWGCVPGIARCLFLPFLPQGDNSGGAAIGPLLASILPGPERSSVEWSHPQPGIQSVIATDLHCPQLCAVPDHSQQGPQTGHHWRLRKRKDHPQGGLKPQIPKGGTGGISVPGVSIWGEKLFCGENRPPLKKSLRQASRGASTQFHTTHNQHATETSTEPAQKDSTFIIIKKIQRNQSERIWRNNLH